MNSSKMAYQENIYSGKNLSGKYNDNLIRKKIHRVFIGCALFISCHSYAAPEPALVAELKFAKARCPSKEFPKFLEAFSENVDFQKKFSANPLKTQRLDSSTGSEPKSLVRLEKKESIRFPLIPDLMERKEKSLRLRIDGFDAVHAQATLIKEGTDYQVIYFFSKESCWTLQAIEDWSL